MVLFLIFLALFSTASIVFLPRLRDAEDKMAKLDSIMDAVDKKPTKILSRDGQLLYQMSAEYRDKAKLSEIPEVVKKATLAAEDKRFYDHQGVDLIALMRVAFTSLKDKRFSQGGSTLTMQLAKRVYTSPVQTLGRKLDDIAIAYTMEKKLTKDQIFELYLNQVYYGTGAYGIRAAAQVYFGKRLEKLSLSDAALLARIVRRPSDENPYKNYEAAIKNRDIVLGIMREENMISETEYRSALDEKPKLRVQQFGSGAKMFRAAYFANYVLDQLKKKFPDIDFNAGGFTIETTVDTRLQASAEAAVRKVVNRYSRQGVNTGAIVLSDTDGRILAMVGGVDYNRNQFNVTFQGKRQPGSSFKPFIYAAALSSGAISPNDSISNEKFVYHDPSGTTWTPKNSGGKVGGSYSIRSAIANSVNLCAVRVIEALTPAVAVQYCHSVFGIKSDLTPVLPLALGASGVSPLEMLEGYSVFANFGDRAEPFGITRVTDSAGNVVYDGQPTIRRRVLDESVCGLMDEYLRAVVTGGTATKARVIPDARGKTGTTSSNRDAWFCGYTNNLIAVAWVANEHFDGKSWRYKVMPRVFGGKVTVEIWIETMRAAQGLLGKGESRRPAHLKALPEIRPSAPAQEPIDDNTGNTPDPAPTDDVQPTPLPGEPVVPTPGGTTPDPGTSPSPGPGTQPDPQPGPGTPPSDPGSSPPPMSSTVQETIFEICTATGKRATIYCPETVMRRFRGGETPKGVCTVHRPNQLSRNH